MRGTDCRRGSPLLVCGLRSIGLFSAVMGGVGGRAMSVLVHKRVPMRRTPRRTRHMRIHRTTPRQHRSLDGCHRRGRSLGSPGRRTTTRRSAHRTMGHRPMHTRGAMKHGSPYPYNDNGGCGGYRKETWRSMIEVR